MMTTKSWLALIRWTSEAQMHVQRPGILPQWEDRVALYQEELHKAYMIESGQNG